jgi:hypothetical protein
MMTLFARASRGPVSRRRDAPLRQASQAHARLASRTVLGKLLLGA